MRSVALACAVLVVPACTSGPNYVIEVGRLQYENSKPVISAPTSGSVNVPFTVHLTTEGGGCITDESTDVTQTADAGELTPYDRRETGTACTQELILLPHDGSFTFDTPGMKTVTVHGRTAVYNEWQPVDVPIQITIQ